MSASVCPRQQGQIDRQTDDQDECDRETVKLNLIRIKCASMTVFVDAILWDFNLFLINMII